MGKLYFLILLITASLTGFSAVIDPDTLIHKGATWKYFDNGIFPGPSWTQASFNDSSWSSGNAELGYGDNDENTVVGYGPDPNNKYITTYFRNSFTFSNALSCKGIRIDLKRDDGAIVYINGQEIYRSNMPTGTITETTLAPHSAAGDIEKYFTLFALGSSNLVNGLNTVAVEVHQNDVTSADMSFDLALVADTDVEIMRGPYLQIATPTSMNVCWRTSIPEISKILYGTTLSYSDSIIDNGLIIDHVVNLTGLLPNTKYYYSVHSGVEPLHEGPDSYFITPPIAGSPLPTKIWAIGDMGTSEDQQNEVRDAYYNYMGNDYTNVILFLGDNAYTTGSDENYTTNVFRNHYEGILSRSVVYSTCGNHDYYSAWGSNQTGPYYDVFTHPKNGEAGGVASGNEAYYSFNYSNIHFVCLESNIDSFGNANMNQMISWIHTDLSTNVMPWTIVYFHCAPYSMGYHNTDVSDEGIFMRENIVPILESYNVDLVLNGHSHDYERTYLMKGHFGSSSTFNSSMIVDAGSGAMPNYYDKRSSTDSGTVYCVAGCGGSLEPVSSGWPHPAMFIAYDTVYGSMGITVNGDTLAANFIDRNGTIRDNFNIIKHAVIGVNEINSDNTILNIFPNPAYSSLNINYLQKYNSEIELSIINSLGQIVKTYSEYGSSLTTRFEIGDFPGGVYMVVVKNNTTVINRIFVKE